MRQELLFPEESLWFPPLSSSSFRKGREKRRVGRAASAPVPVPPAWTTLNLLEWRETEEEKKTAGVSRDIRSWEAPVLPPSLPLPNETSLPLVAPASSAALTLEGKNRKFSAFGLTLSLWDWCLRTPYAAVDPPTLSMRVAEQPHLSFETLLTTPAASYKPDEEVVAVYLSVPSSLSKKVKLAARRHKWNLDEYIKEGIDVPVLMGEFPPLVSRPSAPFVSIRVWVGRRAMRRMEIRQSESGVTVEESLLSILAELAA